MHTNQAQTSVLDIRSNQTQITISIPSENVGFINENGNLQKIVDCLKSKELRINLMCLNARDLRVYVDRWGQRVDEAGYELQKSGFEYSSESGYVFFDITEPNETLLSELVNEGEHIFHQQADQKMQLIMRLKR